MEAAELLQRVTWLGFLVLLVFSVLVVWRRRDAWRFYVIPVLMYALAGAVYYTTVIFFRDLTTAEQRLLGSVVLRLLSIFMASGYLAISLRPRRTE